MDLYCLGLRKCTPRPRSASQGCMVYIFIGQFSSCALFPVFHTLFWFHRWPFSWVSCFWGRVGFCTVCPNGDGGFHLLTYSVWMICILVFVARFAKERRLRIWRDYVAPTANLDQKDKQFVAKVSHSWHLKMPGGHCQLVLIQRSEQSTQSRSVSVLSHWGLHACAVIACVCVYRSFLVIHLRNFI